MISEIKSNTRKRMQKCLEALENTFAKIRTGRAHTSLLDSIHINYYGSNTPLNQVANISVQDARTLVIRVWEKNLIQAVEKAIMKSDLGLNPSSSGEVIHVPLPALTEESRKNYIRQARHETEQSRVAVRNIRRDSVDEVKLHEKEKKISEDDSHRTQDEIQKITDEYTAKADKILAKKELELLEI